MQIHVIYPFSTLNTSFSQSFCIKSNKNNSSNTDVTVFTKGLTKWLQLKNFKSFTTFFLNMKLIKLSVTLFCYYGLIMHFILLQMIVALILVNFWVEVRAAANIESCKEIVQSLLTGQPSLGACQSIWGKQRYKRCKV